LRNVFERGRILAELGHCPSTPPRVPTAPSPPSVATISHEIRTPMNGVIGTVEVLRLTALTGEQVELVDTISESRQQPARGDATRSSTFPRSRRT
jgi:hypothetical protein